MKITYIFRLQQNAGNKQTEEQAKAEQARKAAEQNLLSDMMASLSNIKVIGQQKSKLIAQTQQLARKLTVSTSDDTKVLVAL